VAIASRFYVSTTLFLFWVGGTLLSIFAESIAAARLNKAARGILS